MARIFIEVAVGLATISLAFAAHTGVLPLITVIWCMAFLVLITFLLSIFV